MRPVVRTLDTVPFARDALLPVIFVALYVLLGGLFEFSGHSAGSEIFGAFIAGAAGYFVAYRIRMRGFHDGVKIIRGIADQATLSPGRALYVQMILDRLVEAHKIVDGFQHDTYKVSSPEQLQGWIGTFFELGDGDYIGVDSHSPSRYWSDYAWFLEAHARSLKQRRENDILADDVRILSVDRDELADDWYTLSTRPDYRKFVEWHQENDVELRTIGTSELLELRREHELETGDDVALWIRFAVLFTGQQDRAGEDVTIRLRVKDDSASKPDYEVLSQFMRDVKERSKPMDDAPPGVEMGDAALIARWDDYVAPDIRWRDDGPYQRFMTSVLPPGGLILDAAAGTGTDSVNLLTQQYEVISNEVDPRLADCAINFARRSNIELSLEVSRWEELTLRGNLHCQTVLVLGNSLCLVPSASRRTRALDSFFDVLRPGGVLIIDERNYEFMRQNRDAILADPYENWLKERLDVMYPGRRLVGFPSLIDNSSVSWSFLSNEPEARSSEEVWGRAKEFHPLELYAFQYGELYADLGKAGFKVRAVYGDLKQFEGSGKMPTYEEASDVGFLTYVAERPISADR